MPYSKLELDKHLENLRGVTEKLLGMYNAADHMLDEGEYFMAVDNVSRILYVTSNWEQAIGYSPKEMIDQSFLSFLDEDSFEEELAFFKGLKEREPGIKHTNTYVHKDGSLVCMHWKRISVSEDDDTVYYGVCELC